ncbi:hypothetical protein B0T26DRAFT_744443 [Lasiosphaeria miniovina]|uniref:Uncharacterized protein n=1 Tax=Lasiosphaeria miniovina TaxID=1954250 RepID=A0AA40DL10_9PEZI|nr:uncharacterized protein B0T26DRAFT_744443 [Lasiosphaeria miniovina]KAK0703743.1 hypothetical protein B0T26DRAFT_744443 [Lasiosphaeria miniovina]
MSFCVATQSFIFYILACTPCSNIRHRQRAQQNAKKERGEKARIVLEQPHLYQHPDPFHTNPFWTEEIRMGPSLPTKKRGGGDNCNKNSSLRGLTNPSRDGASVGTASSAGISNPDGTAPNSNHLPVVLADPPKMANGPPIAPDEEATSPVMSKAASVMTNDDWNLKRYQREDEELWGNDLSRTGQKLMDALKQAGTTAGRFVESKLGIEKQVTDEDRHNFYFAPKNPPVNQYHPPVVRSKPAHKDALRWMLQPPPSAKIMEGKVPVSRSSSMMSAGSRRTVTSSDRQSLGRLVGEKSFEAKIRQAGVPQDGELHSTASLNRARSRRTTATSTVRTRSRRTARSNSLSTDSEDSTEGAGQRSRRSRRAAVTPEFVSDEDEDEYISRSLESLSNSSVPAYVAQRPRLSTIFSSEITEKASSTRVDNKNCSTSPLQEVTNASTVIAGSRVKEQQQEVETSNNKISVLHAE